MNDHIYRPTYVAHHTYFVCSQKYGSFYDTNPHRSRRFVNRGPGIKYRAENRLTWRRFHVVPSVLCGKNNQALKCSTFLRHIFRTTDNSCDKFLGAFANLRKATTSFVMSVCPHGTTRLPLHRYSWNLIYEHHIFRKSVAKIQFPLQSYKHKGYFTWITTYTYEKISLKSS